MVVLLFIKIFQISYDQTNQHFIKWHNFSDFEKCVVVNICHGNISKTQSQHRALKLA